MIKVADGHQHKLIVERQKNLSARRMQDSEETQSIWPIMPISSIFGIVGFDRHDFLLALSTRGR